MAALTTLLPALSWGPPAAASADLDIAVVLGFSETFRPGRWTPVIVTVGNRGATVAGEIQVQVQEGDELSGRLHDVVHRRELALTRDSRKRFHFTVFLESLSRPLLVRITSGGRELARHTVDLRQKFTADHLVLVLSRDADLDYLNDGGGRGWRVLYPHPELLPDHWLGYDAVTAVVIHGQSLEALSPDQYEALIRWIARGGTLAVSGGPDYSLLRTPRLGALLPGLPTGMTAIADPAALKAAFPVPPDAAGPLHVNRVPAFRGRARLGAGGVPLVLEERRGAGRVHYLTFDVAREPFDRWPGMKELWLELLRAPGAAPEPAHHVPAPSPLPGFIAAHARGFPGHGTVLLFMVLYLGVLATGYRLPAARGAGRWMLPLATWAAPLVFAPAAYVLFGPVLFDGGASAATVAVVEPLGTSRYARLELDLGVYSSRDGPLRLQYDGAEPRFRAPAGDATGPVRGSGWTFDGGTPRVLAPDARRRYELHLLVGRDVIPFALGAAIEESPAGPRLVVRNDSGRPLEDAWLVFGGSAWFLGAVASDGSLVHPLADGPFPLASNREEWWEVLERHPRADAWDSRVATPLVSRRAALMEAGDFPGPGQGLLIARTTSPLRLAAASAAWHRQDFTLVLYRFPASLRSRVPGMQDFQGDPG